jgi:hypothetical protein
MLDAQAGLLTEWLRSGSELVPAENQTMPVVCFCLQLELDPELHVNLGSMPVLRHAPANPGAFIDEAQDVLMELSGLHTPAEFEVISWGHFQN